MGTLDGRLIALDAKTGRVIWNVAIDGARPKAGYASDAWRRLSSKTKSSSGLPEATSAFAGFWQRSTPRTGKEVWRFKTIPEPGEPGNETWAGDSWKTGGAPIWVTGSYDPELNLTYWGTGNPGPDWDGTKRAGDNLYSDSVIAVDRGYGQLKWHFQFTPHDVFDFDSTQVPVLADIHGKADCAR